MNTNNIIPMHQIGFPIKDYGFRRFFMRGNIKVRTEFLLMAFGYNVNKLYHKTIQNRNGELLHKQQAS
ncbi:hypothetical protein EI970_15805 [Clostridium butyricum]|nr:hypothetical protein EI970_15805 [Clostridium butyricum]